MEKPKKNGQSGYNKELLGKALDEAEKLYWELINLGKIEKGRGGKSVGLDKRYFKHRIVGIAEGKISDIERGRHKCQFSSDEENERKSVCEEKINPLLEKLGYEKGKYYFYNKPIHMGNKNNNTMSSILPDYQLLPNQEKLKDELDKKFKNTAQIIIEAKLDDQKIEEAFLQALTYARRLCAPYIVIATGLKVCIFYSDNNYITTNNPICEYTWKELEDENNLNEIKNLIGKKNFKLDKKTQTYIRRNNEKNG